VTKEETANFSLKKATRQFTSNIQFPVIGIEKFKEQLVGSERTFQILQS